MHVRKLLEAEEGNNESKNTALTQTAMGTGHISQMEKLITHLTLSRIHHRLLIQK